MFDKKTLAEVLSDVVGDAEDQEGQTPTDNGAYQVIVPPGPGDGPGPVVQEHAPGPAGTSGEFAGAGAPGSTITTNFKNLGLVGYETLFVLDANLQRLAHTVGLPTLPPLYGLFKPQFDSSILYNADLVRYNLGKFFYKFPDSNEKFEFLNISLGTNNIKDLEQKGSNAIGIDRFEIPVYYDFHNMGETKASYNESELVKFTVSLPHSLDEKKNYLASIDSFGAWKDFVTDQDIHKLGLGTTPADGYLDFPFIFLHPFDDVTSDEMGVVKVLYTDLKSNYNFYQPAYESVFASPVDNEIPLELYLPNFNVILAEKNNPINASQIDNVENTSVDRNYAIHTTLNNRLEGNILRALEKTDPAYEGVSQGRSGNEYYETWGHVFKNKSLEITSDQALKNVAKKFKNIIFPLEALKTADINITKGSFPFYNEISFNTDTNTQVADILKIAGLFDVLVAYYIESSWGNRNETFYTYQESQVIGGGTPAGAASKEAAENLSKIWATGHPHDIDMVSFDGFVDYAVELISGDSSVLGDMIYSAQDKAISIASEEFFDDEINLLQLNPLTALIKKIKFLSLYETFVKGKARSFTDIMRGKTCYNETLFYRIEKQDTLGNVIQNFYVLNDSQLIDVNLIDTQVMYGKQYRYKIFAVQFVVGNRYNYKEELKITGPESGPPIFDVEVSAQYRASAGLVEVLYVKPKYAAIQESPPLPPVVDFIPYRDNDKEVLILFQNGTGEMSARPEAIKRTDVTAIQSTPKNKDDTVHFRSEGDVTAFEIYRLSEKTLPNGPEKTFDFGDPKLSKKITLSTEDGIPAYVDAISPNTKYWYIFRSLDKKHVDTLEGMNFSNPTNIFEVQMTNEEGAIYFTMNTYDIDYFYHRRELLLDAQKPTKSFRKYLRIKPNFAQTIIDHNPAAGGLDLTNEQLQNSVNEYVENTLNNDTQTIKLGIKEQSVFGFDESNTNKDYNQFKIRIISKKTGRKFDIYTRFRKPILQK